MMKRRNFLAGCGCGLYARPSQAQPLANDSYVGCYIKSAEYRISLAKLTFIARNLKTKPASHDIDGSGNRSSLGGDGPRAIVSATSGNARFDRTLGTILADMSAKFDVRPGFAFYNDSAGKNAVAMPNTLLPGTYGTVLYGMELLKENIGQPNGDYFVMATCAHEFGHILQYKTDVRGVLLNGSSSVRNIELHADFLAGYYLGRRDVSSPSNALVDLGSYWETMGDSNFYLPDHHGTPDQRLDAIEFGYRIGREKRSFNTASVAEIGVRYIQEKYE